MQFLAQTFGYGLYGPRQDRHLLPLYLQAPLISSTITTTVRAILLCRCNSLVAMEAADRPDGRATILASLVYYQLLLLLANYCYYYCGYTSRRAESRIRIRSSLQKGCIGGGPLN